MLRLREAVVPNAGGWGVGDGGEDGGCQELRFYGKCIHTPLGCSGLDAVF